MISKRNSRSLIWEQDITVSALQPMYGQAADLIDQGENGTYKSLIKRKKYILLIIAALVLAEIFFSANMAHWLKAVRYMILTVFMVSRIYRSAENHYTQ